MLREESKYGSKYDHLAKTEVTSDRQTDRVCDDRTATTCNTESQRKRD